MAILHLYVSSWLTWALLALYFLGIFLIFALDTQDIQLRQSIDFASPWNITPWRQLPGDTTPWRQLPGDTSGVTCLSIDSSGEMSSALRPASPLRIPGGMPRLKHLIIYGDLGENQLIPLLEHLQLEKLSIVYLEPLSSAGWKSLADTQLKTLDILSGDERLLDGATFPKSLETLLIRNVNPKQPSDGDSHFRPLLELNRLQTLQLFLWEKEKGGLREADREVLSQLPHLNRLYVQGYAAGIEKRVQTDLPGITVRPGIYDRSRLLKVAQLANLVALPLFVILHVLSFQFASPISKVIPRFSSPNFSIAAVLLTILFVMQSCVLVGARCDLLPAISLAMSATISTYLLTIFSNMGGRFPGYVNLITAMIVVAGQVLFVMPPFVFFAAEADWYLQGGRPEIAVVVIVLGICCLVGMAQFLRRLPRMLAETSASAVPFDVWSVAALQHWHVEGRSTRTQTSGRGIWSIGQRMRLNQALTCPRSSPRWQALLWRASQNFSALQFVIYFSCMMGIFALGIYVFVSLFGQSFEQRFIFPAMFLLQACVMSLFTPLIILQMQRPFLMRHFLMTVGRKEWVKLLFRESLHDLLPGLFVAGVSLLVLHFRHPPDLWPTWQIAILCATILVVKYGVEMILLTYPTWVQIVIVGGAMVILFPLGIYLGLTIQGEMKAIAAMNPFLFWLSWPATWWCLTLIMGLLAIRYAYHRWMNLEFSTISG
jgi:hypothetical protein